MSEFGAVWSEINLDNLANNLNIVRKNIDSTTKILAVVKADAYGHGLCEVARRLSYEGVDYFGVASIDEGAKLIESGITLPVLVLRSILPEEMTDLLDLSLIPSVNCISLAREANLYGRIRNKMIKIQVRIDTGADGDGIPYNECTNFFDKLSEMKWIKIEGIYTHLTSAYGQNDEMVRKQLASFKVAIDTAVETGLHIPLYHAASSPSIFGFPEAHFNMVRVGTALYGIPFVRDNTVSALKPVMQLKARVVCIKEYEDGCNLGYGVDYKELRSVRIAYVSIGYADATFLLRAKNLKVLIGGKTAPLYGNTFMDYIKVDISDFNNIRKGDEVVIFGIQESESAGILELANACGISKVNCESVCFLGTRVGRVFTNVNFY